MFKYIMIATLFYLYEFHIVIDKEHRYYRFRSRFSRQMKDSNIIARMKVCHRCVPTTEPPLPQEIGSFFYISTHRCNHHFYMYVVFFLK